MSPERSRRALAAFLGLTFHLCSGHKMKLHGIMQTPLCCCAVLCRVVSLSSCLTIASCFCTGLLKCKGEEKREPNLGTRQTWYSRLRSAPLPGEA